MANFANFFQRPSMVQPGNRFAGLLGRGFAAPAAPAPAAAPTPAAAAPAPAAATPTPTPFSGALGPNWGSGIANPAAGGGNVYSAQPWSPPTSPAPATPPAPPAPMWSGAGTARNLSSPWVMGGGGAPQGGQTYRAMPMPMMPGLSMPGGWGGNTGFMGGMGGGGPMAQQSAQAQMLRRLPMGGGFF